MRRLTAFGWLTIAIAVCIAIPGASLASYDQWDDAKDIDTTSQSVYQPAVAMSPDGTTFAAWTQYDPVAGLDRVAARLNTPGAGWGVVQLLGSGLEGAPYFPQLAVAADDNALVVWTASNGSTESIFVVDYAPADGWSDSTEIDGELNFSCIQPAVAVDVRGTTTVAFRCFDGSYWSAFAVQRPLGGAWGASDALELATDDVSYIALSVGADIAVVTWNQYDSGNENVFASICEPSSCWSPAAALRNGSSWAYYAVSAVDPAGTVHFAWEEYDGGIARIFYRTYNEGLGLTPSAQMEGVQDWDCYSPAMAIDPQGVVTIAFQCYILTDVIMAARLVPGDSWSAPVILFNDTLLGGQEVRLVADESGAVVAVWQSSWYDYINWVSWYGAWAARYDTIAGWSQAWSLDTRDSRDNELALGVAAGGGDAWAVWYLFDGSNSHIVGAHFTVPDHAAPSLTLSAPLNGTTTTVPTVRITGTTEPKASVSANGVAAVVASNGAFSFLLALAPGNNHVDVTATDPAGNSATLSLNVTFKDPVPGLLASLSATNAELNATRASLSETRGALAETQTDLAAAQADLATAQNNLTALQADLNTTNAVLAEAQEAVSDAQAHVQAAEANVTKAVAKAVAAQSAATALAASLAATDAALNGTQEDLVATNLELDKTEKDLDASNANIVSLTGQVATLSILAAVALLAALAAIALFIVQARRAERGGGGQSAERKGRTAPADVVVSKADEDAGERSAARSSLSSKSARGGELGSADGADGTAPGVVHGSAKGGEPAQGGASSLGSETSQAEAAAGTSEPPAED